MELFSPEFFSALLAIVVIDLVLAGDNAIVIALAARNVPKELQKRAILWGTVGAIAVRTSMTVVVVWLLQVPGLMLMGGAMLVWIAYRLLVPAEEGGGHQVTAASSFVGAMKTIIVAGAAHGNFLLVVLGLLISIPIVICGSQLILKWVERFPSIIYIGAAVLAVTAAKMMLGEPLLKDILQGNALIAPLLYFAVVVGILYYGLRGNQRRVENSIAGQLATLKSAEVAQPVAHNQGVLAMKRILLPVDASANSLKAVEHVIGRCVTEPAIELHLLHVRAPFTRHVGRFLSRRNIAGFHRDEAVKAMRAARAKLDARSIPYAVHVEFGDKADTITAAAKRIRASQIVIGTSRKNSFARMIEDSVTNKVLEKAQVPVEVIAGESVARIERFGVPASIGALFAALVLVLD